MKRIFSYCKPVKYIAILLIGCVFFNCKNEAKTAENIEETIASEIEAIQTLKIPVKGNAHLPRLKAAYGKLHMTWVEEKDSLATLNYAFYENNHWSPSKTISSGTDWFVNWADFPALAINGEAVLTNILQKSAEGTYDYDIKLNLFSGEKEIKSDFLLHTDGISAEHGFVAMAPYDDGFYVSWLDGRNTKSEDVDNNAMTLFSAIVDLNGTVKESTEIDHSVCDCCNTAIGITYQGPIVVYRDRSEGEDEVRDISIVRWVDGAWTRPKTINDDHWQINGCPVNGPAIDTQQQNVIVSWFTAASDDPRVLVAFSHDNGATFGTPLRVDSGRAIGRIDTAFLTDGSALVLWMEPYEENTLIRCRRVYPDGRVDDPVTITETDAARASGFPQLEVIDETVYIAFTELEGEYSTIKIRAIDFQSIEILSVFK